MSGIRLATRLSLYFYGTPNIVGCVCGLGVLALYFAGVIAQWWLPLTLASYAFGVLIAPRGRRIETDVDASMTLVEVIDAVLTRASGRLPAEAVQKLTAIRDKVQELLPRWNDPAFPPIARIDLVAAIRRDLTSTIANYTALPASFAALHALRDGRTAKQLLIEQLDILESEVGSIAKDVFVEDAYKLAAHGEYLRSKVQSVDFLRQ
jgi:hypothetical protein